VPAGKYAVVERERRFLPPEVPDVSGAVRVLHIEDRYVEGTRLRARTVTETGRPVVHKLGQKVRDVPDDPSVLAHTTLYLSGDEHRLLAGLPARTLRKVRHLVPLEGGLLAGVDVFAGQLDGLVLVEVDLGESGELADPVPHWFGREVTDDESFTGGTLASLDGPSARALVRALHV